MEFIVSVTNF